MKLEIILFTRFPVAGRAKTRLLPHLGAEGAAQVQREMTEHVLARAWPLVKRRDVALEVRFEDGSHAAMRQWLGNGLRFAAQGDGDLGARMLRATNQAFEAGTESVIIIGADCPELDAALLERAFDLLRTHPVVFGPAKDGGYYLVGLGRSLPALFQGIAWSTGSVLADSVARCRQLGIEPCLLPRLSDVDEPSDLPAWEKECRTSRTVSVIIPTLNEAERLPATLRHVAAGEPTEIIVADGGSRDETLGIAQSHGVKIVASPPNRARQMNAGAAAARGETLLFLHADTLLPANFRDAISAAFRQPQVVGGAFRFRIADAFHGRRFIERSVNLRSRLWRMPYGDQALFVRRWAFDELGGFPDLPIVEDYEFVRRLRRLGRLALLNEAVLTSARRWQRLGLLRTTLINQLVIIGYHCGVSPIKLAALYRGRNPRSHGDAAVTATTSPRTGQANESVR
jgi:rSAM/selenodomain-associated transferase 2/rSAM/selenodomain-associated transferase 1